MRTEPVHHDMEWEWNPRQKRLPNPACPLPGRVACFSAAYCASTSSALGFAGRAMTSTGRNTARRLLQERELSAAEPHQVAQMMMSTISFSFSTSRQGHSLAVKGGDGEILYLVAHLIGNRFPFGGATVSSVGSRGLRSGALRGPAHWWTAHRRYSCSRRTGAYQRQRLAKQRFVCFILFSPLVASMLCENSTIYFPLSRIRTNFRITATFWRV